MPSHKLTKKTETVRSLRKTRMKSPYGVGKAKQAALRNPRRTRGQARVLQEFADGEYFLQPAAPARFFKGSRPNWQNSDAIWLGWGGKGAVLCFGANCLKTADSIDHKVDWKTYILTNCDMHREDRGNGFWEGFLKTDVINAYNDIENLQPMCTACNSTKNGPKFYDGLKATFHRR